MASCVECFVRRLLFLAVLFASRDAHAWACAGEPLRVYPPPGVIPTNAQIRVVFPNTQVGVGILGPQRQNLDEGTVSSTNPTFVLRGAGAAVPMRARQLAGPKLASYVLEPALPLVPSQTYVLAARTNGRNGTSVDFPIAEYQTTNSADTTAPVLTSVKRAKYFHLAQIAADGKQSSGPWVELEIEGDAQTAYEILAPNGDLRAVVFRPQIDDDNPCTQSDMQLATKGTETFGVRLVDAAGNASAVKTFTVDADHPIRSR